LLLIQDWLQDRQDEKRVEETLASLETEYQLNEQNLENRALEAESEKAKLEADNNRNAFFGLGLIIALLIVIALIAIALIRRTQKFNAQLEAKVQEKTQAVLLRDQQLKTTAFKLAPRIYWMKMEYQRV
jgi:flagellar biosynthesis/type III secretory pathway M-ring protein FliF/YscJ